MKNAKSEVRGPRAVLVLLLFVLSFAAAVSKAASITEPATVFYGRIIGTGSEQPFLITEGEIIWTVRRADGVDLTLRAGVFPPRGTEYSYRLDVPHEMVALGLTGSAASVPLRATEEVHAHWQISVDGRAARIISPNGSAFAAAQGLRAAAYQLDLEVPLEASDTDGNGLPDWWEKRFGMANPLADPDGDGRNNVTEYRDGTDPNHDDRVPSLATREIRVYAEGTTALMLRGIDTDTSPANLVYTLKALPGEGSLYLRNASAGGSSHDVVLEAGATFSQADLNRGRVVFVHGGPAATEAATSFDVTLQDGTAGHVSSTNRVAVTIYRPARALPSLADFWSPGGSLTAIAGFSAEEQEFVASFMLSKEMGHIVVDSSTESRDANVAVPSSGLSQIQYQNDYIPSFGPDRRHILLGGGGRDRLDGSMESDILIGRRGDDSLRGNAGGDLFVVTTTTDGNDTIEDFNISENDRVDFTRVLNGSSVLVHDYLRISSSGGNSTIGINFQGTGGYTDMIVTLRGVQFQDLFELVESGHVIAGDKVLLPRVNIVASAPVASENGPTPGVFTLTRRGPADSECRVNLMVTGSAANGVDYQYVSSPVTFLAGQSVVTLEITPYVDAITELAEVVEIALQPGNGYELGTLTRASVTIEDLAPQIAIAALEPLASKADQTRGVFLITRSGVLDRSLLVRLTIGGTATQASDYDGVPSFINLQANQTTALIEVLPRTAAVLANGAEFVQLSIASDSTYRVGSPSSARVVIVDEQLTFSIWRNRYFADTTTDLLLFADQDSGQTGIRHLQRYAFGLDAHTPQSSPGRPAFLIRDNHLTVAFCRPPAVRDVQYSVEVSDDLVAWHSGQNHWEEYAAPEYAGRVDMICYRAKQSVAETSKLFVRVRVAYAP